MSPSIKVLTIILWLLPFSILMFSYQERLAVIVCLLIILLYGSIWIWFRPSRFTICTDYLKIVFPGRQLKIPFQDILSVSSISIETFKGEFGWAMRIGAGGLWGGFGWLWTSKKGMLEFYISRVEEFVFIERLNKKSLLITPENPAEFVKILQRQL
ncbi:PH domain-containing protein [Gloeocapsa sp. PCC 73106]|uniref:PH domain-containing protein n=1 Tax=Gloeocapsa sp. PCC 73106 TaxID=102232 RepID=UPI001930C4EA|nr:PH domain-containing protein [Gloeocapsa sp. PCC 73106]